jgi:DNA modification methylase
LRDDGTVWLNLGDSYWGGKGQSNYGFQERRQSESIEGKQHNITGMKETRPQDGIHPVLKPKDLCMIPSRVALALQSDGWYLRSDIIWSKCLSGGMVVYAKTQKGEMPTTIKDLVRLDPQTVKLWDGRKWNQVVKFEEHSSMDDRYRKSQITRNKRYRGKESPILGDIEIELRNGERIGCTRSHKWITDKSILVQAENLKIGDILMTTILPEPRNPRLPIGLRSEEIGWFVGLYIAEGSLSNGTIQMASHINEQERFERLYKIAESFDGHCTKHQTSKNGMTININSPILLGLIETYVSGKTAKRKHLNIRCWKRSNGFLKSIIQGFLEGDGHQVDSGFWKITITNNDFLIQDLRIICARLEYSLRMRRRKSKIGDTEYPCWRGDLYLDKNRRKTPDSEIVAIRQSRARKFWMISLVEEPHLFALSSGILTGNSNPMPESVTDRPTKAHEYVFLLSKNQKYYYDADAVREPISNTSIERWGTPNQPRINPSPQGSERAKSAICRNKRTVWEIATQPFPEAHFAVFPEKLIEPCILAGTSEKGCCPECGVGWKRKIKLGRVYSTGGSPIGARASNMEVISLLNQDPLKGAFNTGKFKAHEHITERWDPSCECQDSCSDEMWFSEEDFQPIPCIVLDPFIGSGTTAIVALKHNRSCIGIDLSPDYVKMAKKRIAKECAQLNLRY